MQIVEIQSLDKHRALTLNPIVLFQCFFRFLINVATGKDAMQFEIEENYRQIKADVQQIVAAKLQRIENDPELKKLLKK